MKTSALLLIAFLFAFSACKNRQAPQDKPVDQEPPVSSCKPVEEGRMPDSDQVISIEAAIKDGCLEITATYGGGCKDHEFRLFWNGLWAESMPPQTGLILHHNANDDNCRAIKSSTVTFDLSKLKYDGVNEVQLNLRAEGAEENLRIKYEY
jgi:hypothetical protein